MAIVFRNLTDLTVNGMTARLTVSAAGGKLKVTLEPYNSATTTAYTKGAQVEVTYNGEGQTLVSSPFTSAVTAVFVQAAEVKSLTLSSASTLTYDGTSSTSLTISWKGDGSVAAPVLSIASYSGLMIGQVSRIVWQFDNVPEGYFVRTVGLWFHYAETTGRAPSYTRTAIFTEKRLDTVYEHTVADLETNNVVFYRIAAAVYESDADALNDYVAYTEIDSSPYVCSGDSVYTLAPVNLRYRPVRNVPFTIRWELLPAATFTNQVTIEYSTDGGAWTQLYQGAALSCTHTITSAVSQFCVRARATSTRSTYERSSYLYGSDEPVVDSNVYVGRNGVPVMAAGVYLGTRSADSVLRVG